MSAALTYDAAAPEDVEKILAEHGAHRRNRAAVAALAADPGLSYGEAARRFGCDKARLWHLCQHFPGVAGPRRGRRKGAAPRDDDAPRQGHEATTNRSNFSTVEEVRRGN